MSRKTLRFDRGGVRLFQGDARQLVRHLEVDERSVVVTDPVWPNSGRTTLAGREAPEELLAVVLRHLVARGLRRAIVILGVDSDPRFLAAVPAELPFRRATWLRHTRASYKGPVLVGAEIAYVFGDFRMAHRGQVVWPGEIVDNDPRDAWSGTKGEKKTTHPCPRKIAHVRGLLVGYCRDSDRVIDPFAGSCTTLASARMLGREADGIEIDPGYCEEARARLAELCGETPSAPSIGPLFARAT